MSSPILKDSGLEASTQIASELMEQIQSIVNQAWTIDTTLGGGSLQGTPNNLEYDYEITYSDSGTIVPGVPAVTITPSFYTPAVVTPAVPGYGTLNLCGPWSKCTSEIPGSPAITVTPGFTTPAVITPAIPALTGGYSTELDISAQVVGISQALEPLFSSITFESGSMGTPDSSGLANETVTYNLDQKFAGTALQISGRAAFDDLTVDIAGVDTNFGNISTGTMDMSGVPDVPIKFDAVVVIPSYNDASKILNTVDGVGYSLFPQTNQVSIDNFEISTGVTAMADFIDDYLLDYLTDFWNATIVPMFTAVGADAPTAPSQTLSDDINNSASSLQKTVNTEGESAVNSILKSSLSTIQPYVQALTASVWDYSTYPIFPGGNFSESIMTNGLFSGVDASQSKFTNANLSNSDFSGSNLTGADFTGANLSGANFSGATGAPTASLQKARKSQSAYLKSSEDADTSLESSDGDDANFKNAVLFGAKFQGSNGFNLNGAFYNKSTKLGGHSKNELNKFSAPIFVASNKKLLDTYGLDFKAAAGHFISDITCEGKSNKDGIRTDVVNGDLDLNSFNAKKYSKILSDKQSDKLTNYKGGEVGKKELLAIHKIVSSTDWSDADSAEYLTANSKLIKKLGGSDKAMNKAKNHYLNNGIFKDHSLNAQTSDYYAYVQNYPGSVRDSGGTIDEASIAYNYVTSGYDQGQTF
jgi:hypothetical protein